MEEKYKSNRAFHLRLTVLSPLVINSGEELSPLSDYYVANGRVNYIDEQKFRELLFANEELMLRYAKNIETTEISLANMFLNKLISNEETLKNISHSKSIPFKGGNTIQLKAIIKSKENPYIPGSAIKGAIKNTMLYYWLTILSPYSIENFIKKNKNYFDDFLQCKDKLLELRGIPFGKRSKDIKNEYKILEKKEKAVKQIFNSFVEHIQKKAFDIGEDLYQPASNLKISDSKSVSFTENVEVAELNRRRLRSNAEVAELKRLGLSSDVEDWVLNMQEYVKEYVEFDAVLQISDTDQDWQNFQQSTGLGKTLQESKKNLKPLFTILNHFSNAQKDTQSKFNLTNPIKGVNLQENEALICLGSGKGVYKSTVLLAIRKYYEHEAMNFQTEFAPLIVNIKEKFEDFPNSVSHINKLPLGWIKISDSNLSLYKENIKVPTYKTEFLKAKQQINGILVEKGVPAKVQISLDGEIQLINASGMTKYEKMNKENLFVGKMYTFEIVAIKDNLIKDIKFI